MNGQVNIDLVRRLREELRAVLPELQQSGRVVSNETLSACLGLLTEAAVLRLIQEIQRLRGTQVEASEALALTKDMSRALSDSLINRGLVHVPDATMFYSFRPPKQDHGSDEP